MAGHGRSTRVMTPIAVAAVIVAIGVLVWVLAPLSTPGTGTVGWPAASASTQPESSPLSTARASAGPAAPCTGAQLVASVGPAGPAMGTENIWIVLHNTSQTA